MALEMHELRVALERIERALLVVEEGRGLVWQDTNQRLDLGEEEQLRGYFQLPQRARGQPMGSRWPVRLSNRGKGFLRRRLS
jgi:hypothetical protein